MLLQLIHANIAMYACGKSIKVFYIRLPFLICVELNQPEVKPVDIGASARTAERACG